MDKDRPETQNVAIRKDMFGRMKAAGVLEDRSTTWMVNKACEEFLERSEKESEQAAAE